MLTVSNNEQAVGKRKLPIISAYVQPELKADLEAWAAEESRSLSSLMVYLLTKAVREHQRTKED